MTLPHPTAGVYLVGVHDTDVWPSDRWGRELPQPLQAAIAGVVAAVSAAAVMALVVEGARLIPAVVAALIAAVVTCTHSAMDGSGGVVASASRLRGRLWRHSVAAALTGLTLAVVADLAGWGLGPSEALLVAVVALGFGWATDAGLTRLGRRNQRILVVGTGVVARHLAISIGRGRRASVVGHVDDGRLPAGVPEGVAPLLGDLGDIPALIAEQDIDLVVFSFVSTPQNELGACAAACRAAGVRIAVVSRLFEGLQGDLSLGRLEGFPVISAEPRLKGRMAGVPGRLTDILVAGALLLLTAPIWLAVAVAIKLESRGGVFYLAPRIGRHGIPFRMLKFRKMRADAAGPALTLADDERFTRMGRFLAHTKLDELPQLWNVVRGEMSLVGPRPEDARYVATHVEDFDRVLTVRPGITGLSQIGFRREFEHFVGADFEEYYLRELLPWKLAVDRYYVDHRSWLTDMRILIWTARALVRGGELDVDPLAPHVAFRSGARAPAPPS